MMCFDKMKYILSSGLLFAVLIVCNIACQDDPELCMEVDVRNIDQEQLEKDIAIIDSTLDARGVDYEIHESGIRYVIIEKGTGQLLTTLCATITVHYTGRFLDDTSNVFDASRNRSSDPLQLELNQLIAGWKFGIPLIRELGKVDLYIPSGLAYGSSGTQTVPENSNLYFTVELFRIQQ